MRKFITTQAAQDGGYGWSILFAKRDKTALFGDGGGGKPTLAVFPGSAPADP